MNLLELLSLREETFQQIYIHLKYYHLRYKSPDKRKILYLVYYYIDDKFISVYTNTKCDSIMKLSFLKIRCFRGFELQFSHLTCPYQFKVEEYFVAMIYGEGSQIEENN